MKEELKKLKFYGFYIDIYHFGYASFMYPSFNGNAEFRLNKKGFKQLCSYLRTIRYIERLRKDVLGG